MTIFFSNTAFFSNTMRRLRISGSFTGYRRNAEYDSQRNDGRIVRALGGGYLAGDDAVAERRTAEGMRTGAVVWRRSAPAVAPSSLRPVSLLLAFGRFLWAGLMRILRRLQPVSVVLFALFLAFLVGFVAFGEKVTGMTPPVIGEPADAIVVLTGGQSRVQAAVDLLKDKRGGRLLISGVHPATNEKTLRRATHADQSLFDCCVDLDRSARNTAGNAEESERWIRSNGYRRVIVVTNNYHMPRSVLEMSHRMRDVEFVPYPVVNGDRRAQNWVSEGDALRVLFMEYVKYLGAVVRVGASEFLGFDILGSGPEQKQAGQ